MRDARSMRRPGWAMVCLLVFVALGAGSGEADLLRNAGFKENHPGDAFPTAGWRFSYNTETTGSFVEADPAAGPGPALKVVNPLPDKGLTVETDRTTIPESGKYRATIWAKTDADAHGLKGDAIEMTMFVLRSDYKGGNRKTEKLRNNWLKYELEVEMAPGEVGQKYFFRIDIKGTGTFQIAGPSLELMDIAPPSTPVLPPLVETAHFSFDGSLDEDGGKTQPGQADKTSFVPGLKGQAVTVADTGALSYPLKDLLRPESGAMAAWIRTTNDPLPTFAPADTVALKIIGENELGKKDELLTGQISTPGLRSSFRSAYGNRAVEVRPIKAYYGNEWRHYIWTWDKRDGLRVFLDGRQLLVSKVGDDFFKHLPEVQFKTIGLLTGIGWEADQQAFIDELRFFNRPLTEDEALALYEDYVPAYPVLLDYAAVVGSSRPYRVKMLKNDSPAPIEMTATAETTDGKQLLQHPLTIDKTGNYAIPFVPPAAGDYRLVFSYKGQRIRTFEITAVIPDSLTAAMPESVSGDVQLKLLDEIDCAKTYPADRYLDDGEVRVADSPIGPYRESTRTTFVFDRPNGFAYHFTVRNPGRPHWLEIEYPDDQPRAFYVVVEEKADNHGWGDHTYTSSYNLNTIGIANGINNPVTGKFSTKRLLFWPDAEKIFVACFGYKTLPGMAGPALKRIRLYENDGPLPRVAVNTPDGMPLRQVGNWQEDPGMPNGCWFKKYRENQGPSFGFWEDKLSRRIQYIRFMGENQTTIQIFPYSGDNNGAHGVFPPDGFGKLMPGWACLAATMFEREGIPFHLQFNDRGPGIGAMVGPEKISADAFEAAAKGVDSLEVMTAEGTLAKCNRDNVLNFLRPEVRAAHLERIRFYREQFGIYRTFRGVSYWYSFPITFVNETTGYGDYTISRFEAETGAKIPVESRGMERFGKRYEWLKSSDLWQSWIDWRCAKVTDFLQAMSRELNAGPRHDLTVLIPLATETKSTPFIIEQMENYPQKLDLVAGLKTMGIDIAALNRDPSLILEPMCAPNYGLLYKKAGEKNLDAFWYSDDFSDLYKASTYPAFMLSRHANMEIYGSKGSGIKKFWWPFGYWGDNGAFHCFSDVQPDNLYVPQTLAWALANCDIRRIDHGWWGNPENGAHHRFQQFYRAFSSIPSVPFTAVPGTNDPVAVRQYNSPDGNGWFYLVNQQSYPTTVQVSFATAPTLTDAVYNRPQKTNGKTFELELAPYQLACYRSDRPLQIVEAKQLVPADVVSGTKRTVDALRSGAQIEPSPPAELLVKKAEELLAQQRYSALYYLCRSYSATQLIGEGGQPVSFRTTMSPDGKSLLVEATNRMAAAATVELALTDLPAPLACPQQRQQLSLNAKESKAVSFPLTGLDLGKTSCRDELTFTFTSQVDQSDAQTFGCAFHPVVCTPAKAVTVDGDLADWANARWYEAGPCDFSLNFKGKLQFGLPPFACTFATAWDTKGLYLAVKVHEKDFMPAPAGEAAWHYEFMDIFFDQSDNAPARGGEIDDDDSGFSLVNQETGTRINLDAPAKNQSKDMGAQCVVKRQRQGQETAYEVFFPAAVLSQAELKPGANIGFGLKVHNRERERSDRDLWGMAVSTPAYPYKNPSSWNDLLLLDANR